MKMYAPAYLRRLRECCSRYGAHLIADEIAVGFGRSGTLFACEQAHVVPDIMCLSKGITSGYMPLSLVLATDAIYEAFFADSAEGRAFLHSHSYSGNALACALAVETLKIFEEEQIVERNRGMAAYIGELVRRRAEGNPCVGNWRQLGMVTALDVVERSGAAFSAERRKGWQICRQALDRGLLLRPLGDTIYFMPPYVIKEDEAEFMVETVFDLLDSL